MSPGLPNGQSGVQRSVGGGQETMTMTTTHRSRLIMAVFSLGLSPTVVMCYGVRRPLAAAVIGSLRLREADAGIVVPAAETT
jgi:hypothetical protein